MELEWSGEEGSYEKSIWDRCRKKPETITHLSAGIDEERNLADVNIKRKGQHWYYFENVPLETYLDFKKQMHEFWRKEKERKG